VIVGIFREVERRMRWGGQEGEMGWWREDENED
jgi:hypothetical protein